MSNLQRRADIPVCHRGFNACPEYDELENPSSGMPSKQDFNYGRFAVIKTNGRLDSINERPAATVKKSLIVKTDGELCPNPVVRDSRTTAANGKTYDVAHYNQGPSRHQVSTMWAPSRSSARVTARLTGYAISYLQKYRLTEKGRRLLAQLEKKGDRL